MRILAGFVERAHAKLVPAQSEVDLLRALARDRHDSFSFRGQRIVEKKSAGLLFRAGGGVVYRELSDAGMFRLAADAPRGLAEIVVKFYAHAVPRGARRLRCVRLAGRRGGYR